MPLAKLGDFKFDISTATFESLTSDFSWDWAGVRRVRRPPAQQFTGPGEIVKEIKGTIMPVYNGGIGQIAALREMADRGEPLFFVCTDATVGEFLGNWCIRSIKETRTHLMDGAIPQKIEFSMTIVAYGDDELELA